MHICSTLRFIPHVCFCGRTILVVFLWLGNLSWNLESNVSSIVLFLHKYFWYHMIFSSFCKEGDEYFDGGYIEYLNNFW